MSGGAYFDEILIRARNGMRDRSGGAGGRKPAVKFRAERVWQSLTASGSAFIKRIPGAGVQHPKQLAGQLAYINGKARATFGTATGVVAGEEAFAQDDLERMMAAWSDEWKGHPRNGHTSHIVVSFPDDVSADTAKAIAQEWAAEMFEDRTHVDESWEYVAALHTDTPNPHVHVVLNNRGVGGQWFSLSSRGVFTPQMMRDRLTDIGDIYGVRLESLTRADRGLYNEPITSAEIFATREGRTIANDAVRAEVNADWRDEDRARTAALYGTLADFAEVIGKTTIAQRANAAAQRLMDGKIIAKGQVMEVELDVTADREDIRTSLIEWATANRAQIDALPEVERRAVMQKIDAALDIVESDVAPDLTAETVWAAYAEKPASYLVPDRDALEARAAQYVPANRAALMDEFVEREVLDTYLVTGEVPQRFAPVMPAVASAYEEMHDHRLDEIPKAMNAYIEKGEKLGLDGDRLRDRLVERVADPAANLTIERDDIARIVRARGEDLADAKAVARAGEAYREFQLALGEVEEELIEASTVYERDGVARVLQDAASTAATTGRADLADSSVGREVLKGFVALEGREAMRELSEGNVDALAEYVDTPANQRLAAKELLKSAKQVDVGLDQTAIEDGLEAVDPTYSRSRGLSI